MTTTAPAPARPAVRAPTKSTLPFLLPIIAIAAHVIDDSFVQPQPGTSAGDHLISGLVPLIALAASAWLYLRVRGAWRGAIALLLAPLGIAAGIEAFYYAREAGPAGDDFTGLLCIPAGLALLAHGAATLWRTRRRGGSVVRRALVGFAGLLVAAMVVVPVAVSYVDTHVARAVVPEANLGAPHDDVSFETEDGLTLRGWYVPSRNGAAVIAFPGRKIPQAQTRMLARHGYGVLLFDRRGEGESDGDPHVFGWGGDADVKAAIAYLRSRPDVDPERIGGIGLSVGGELMLEAAAETDRLAAVVSEGAGARVLGERLDVESTVENRVLNFLPNVIQTASLAVLSDQAPPTHLKDLVGRIGPRPALLIAAPNSPNGEDINRLYHAAAGDSAELWEIPESDHIGGIEARPQEYERRVVGFFDAAL